MGHPALSFGSPVLLAGGQGQPLNRASCPILLEEGIRKKKKEKKEEKRKKKIQSFLFLILFDIGESHERLLKMLKTEISKGH